MGAKATKLGSWEKHHSMPVSFNVFRMSARLTMMNPIEFINQSFISELSE